MRTVNVIDLTVLIGSINDVVVVMGTWARFVDFDLGQLRSSVLKFVVTLF